jgi:hypothetical protein
VNGRITGWTESRRQDWMNFIQERLQQSQLL